MCTFLKMRNLLIPPLLFAASLIRSSQGYYLDDSCHGDWAATIKDAMAQNQKVASNALGAMREMERAVGGDNKQERSGLGQLEEEALARFLGTLVGEDGRPMVGTDDWRFTMETLAWIVWQTEPPTISRASEAGEQRRPPGTPQEPPEPAHNRRYGALTFSSVVLFCDTSRYQPLERPLNEHEIDESRTALDAHLGIYVIHPDDDLPADSYDAWATTGDVRPPVLGEEDDQVTFFPAFVQLSPKLKEMIEKAHGAASNTVDTLAPGLVKADDGKMPARLKRNLDFTLFHEMSHTYKGTKEQRIWDEGGYEWDECLRASTTLGPFNANNLAFFAFTSYLIRHDPPIEFTDSGKAKAVKVPRASRAA